MDPVPLVMVFLFGMVVAAALLLLSYRSIHRAQRDKISSLDLNIAAKQQELLQLNETVHSLRSRLDSIEQTSAAEISAQQSLFRSELEKDRAVAASELNRQIEVLRERKDREHEALVKHIRKDSSDRSRAVIKGKIGEQMAPLLSEFYSKYELSDARFFGEPIDYIIFKNLTRYKDEMQRRVPPEERSRIDIVLADIKTGQSRLSPEQRMIRDAVLQGRVLWDEIRINLPHEGPAEPTYPIELFESMNPFEDS